MKLTVGQNVRFHPRVEGSHWGTLVQLDWMNNQALIEVHGKRGQCWRDLDAVAPGDTDVLDDVAVAIAANDRGITTEAECLHELRRILRASGVLKGQHT